MKKTILTSLWILVFTNSATAQDVASVIDKALDYYNKSAQHVITANYNLYVDSTSKIKKDEQKSELVKNGNSYYFKMGSSEIIHTDTFFIKISHPEKMILYSKVNENTQMSFNNQAPFVDFLNQFKSKKLIDKGNYWECVLSANQSSDVPYNKIVLHINKANYMLKKQIYYFNTSVEKRFDSNSQSQTAERLEITQTAFSKTIAAYKDVFNLDKYLIRKNNAYTVSNYIKNYRIIIQ